MQDLGFIFHVPENAFAKYSQQVSRTIRGSNIRQICYRQAKLQIGCVNSEITCL